MNSEELSRAEQAKKEYERLIALFDGISTNRLVAVEPLVLECARLKVRLDALWENICEFGEIEQYGNHERQRAASSLYNTLTAQYYKILYNISGMIPKDGELKAKTGESELDKFLNEITDDSEEVATTNDE